jgi:hypothetical protein
MTTRKQWVNAEEPLSVVRQCWLTGVARSGVYTEHDSARISEEEHLLLGEIDAEYTRYPFYGSPSDGGLFTQPGT